MRKLKVITGFSLIVTLAFTIMACCEITAQQLYDRKQIGCMKVVDVTHLERWCVYCVIAVISAIIATVLLIITIMRKNLNIHEIDKETNTTEKKSRGCVDCSIYPSQDCGECGVWASNNELSRAELGRQLKIDAIDDFVECLMANEVVDKSVVRRTAEQFKEKLEAKKTK